MKQALCVIAVVVAGCSDPSNSQYLPIGSRCSSPSSCGTAPFDCRTSGYPGGYCDKPCATSGDCPADAECALVQQVRACRRRCAQPSECRQSEGYTCMPLPVTPPVSVCDVPAAVDGGQPAG